MKKLVSLWLALCLLLGLMAGCGSADTAASEAPAEAETAESAPEVEEAPSEAPAEAPVEPAETEVVSAEEEVPETPEIPKVEIQYPLEEGGTVSVWMEFQMNLSSFVETIADIPIEAELAEAIGVNVEFTEVSMSAVQEAFNLMVTSRDMRDIISGGSAKYTAGLDSAVDEEIYVDLLEYLPDNAPDYWAMLNQDPDFLKQATTDSGYVAAVYAFYDSQPIPDTGLVMRGDLLEAVGMEKPETYEEMEAVLTALQNYGVAHPMYSCFGMNSFISSGFGVSGFGFYDDGGEIKFTVVEDGYRDYIQLLHDWCAKGFFPDDWLSLNNPMVDAAVTTGEAAIFEQSANRLPQILSSMADPNATIIPICEPVQEAGQQRHFSNIAQQIMINNGATVTTSCENVELALKYLNYFYTEPGIMAFNYGSEGVSYELDENGDPQFTDLILNNPDGLSINQALDYNTYNGYAGRVTMISVQTMFYDETQKTCAQVWGEDNDAACIISGAVTRNNEEADIYNTYYSDIETLVDEQLTKFIVGDLDMSEFDSFVAQIKGMGLDQVLEVYQSAYDRYLTR